MTRLDELVAALDAMRDAVVYVHRGYALTHVVRGQVKGQFPVTADEMSMASEYDYMVQTALHNAERLITEYRSRDSADAARDASPQA